MEARKRFLVRSYRVPPAMTYNYVWMRDLCIKCAQYCPWSTLTCQYCTQPAGRINTKVRENSGLPAMSIQLSLSFDRQTVYLCFDFAFAIATFLLTRVWMFTARARVCVCVCVFGDTSRKFIRQFIARISGRHWCVLSCLRTGHGQKTLTRHCPKIILYEEDGSCGQMSPPIM